jgi:chaperonin cofactor prefoldin
MSERDRRRLSSRISLLERLEARVQHLEIALEGLQDSVHRDATRYDDLIAELQRRTQPAALAQAISTHSRARGL